MPELVHDCGKTVRFPPGTEGKKGKCPHCGGRVDVPLTDEAAPSFHLLPPPNWDEYQAYLDDRGPPPRETIMPHNLMLKTEADEKWERSAKIRPSKFFCPSCKERINVDQVICTKCGVDFRTGLVLGKSVKLNEKGMKYLLDIPWLADARASLAQERRREGSSESSTKLRGKAPKKKKSGTSRLKRKRF